MLTGLQWWGLQLAQGYQLPTRRSALNIADHKTTNLIVKPKLETSAVLKPHMKLFEAGTCSFKNGFVIENFRRDYIYLMGPNFIDKQ